MSAIAERVQAFIADPSSDDFDALALAVHDYQYRHNLPYRRYAERTGPHTPRSWREIPAVPAFAFKVSPLMSAPAVDVFLSSGTTEGPERRARHHVPDLAVYRTAALAGFRRAALAEGERRRFLVAAPERASHPASSLGAMVTWLREEHDAGDEPSFLVDGGIDLVRFARALDVLGDEPVLIVAVTGALLRLADYAETRARPWRLPAASLVVDTGGCKGYSDQLARDRILARYRTAFGLEPARVVNEYGMTEMCSQLYARGHDPFVPPPWVRSLVCDPATGREVAPGEPGLLRHLDLANLGSVLAVQTEDVGRAAADGFDLLGRVDGAEPRGCSLLLAS
jgi:hypothetical protein